MRPTLCYDNFKNDFSEKFIVFSEFAISLFEFDETCRDFANVVRKWKTTWGFSKIIANICEISLKFPKPNKLFIFNSFLQFTPE